MGTRLASFVQMVSANLCWAGLSLFGPPLGYTHSFLVVIKLFYRWMAYLPGMSKLYRILQVASGMNYLHSRSPAPVLHGDLKTGNLLIEDDSSKLVIADFGLAGWTGGSGPTSHAAEAGAHTVTIAPPEVRRQ
jgi:serine/threonine protein kinase